jgi:hypothetical protein
MNQRNPGQRTRKTSALLTTSAPPRTSVTMRLRTLTRHACANTSAAGAELTKIRAGGIRLGSAGIRVSMVVVDSLVRGSTMAMLSPVDHLSQHWSSVLPLHSWKCRLCLIWIQYSQWTGQGQLPQQTSVRFLSLLGQGNYPHSQQLLSVPQPLIEEPNQH